MSRIQPELWVDRPREAVAFYEAAFGAVVLHRVGDGEEIVAQLAVDEAVFWVGSSSASMGRFSPQAIGGATSRTLLVVDDPDGALGRLLPPARPRSLPWPTTTVGAWDESLTLTVTSGRSGDPSVAGLRADARLGDTAVRHVPSISRDAPSFRAGDGRTGADGEGRPRPHDRRSSVARPAL